MNKGLWRLKCKWLHDRSEAVVLDYSPFFSLTGERYMPGVGRVSADDFMRREIIHKLCLRPMTHSELMKALPVDSELEDEEGVDGIIESVSTFKYVRLSLFLYRHCFCVHAQVCLGFLYNHQVRVSENMLHFPHREKKMKAKISGE